MVVFLDGQKYQRPKTNIGRVRSGDKREKI
jgi:hypothetical protein